jgi:predicted nucleic acid-binding protein
VILVDTSIWIDHLHASEARLVEMLGRDEVGSHPLVVEELALGSIKDRVAVLDALRDLRAVPLASHAEVMRMVESQRLWGRGLSAVDVHLLSAVLIAPGWLLWTRDKRVRTAARDAGAQTVAWN